MTGNEDRTQDTAIALLGKDIDYVKKSVDDIAAAVKKIAEKDYVTRGEVTAKEKAAGVEHTKLGDSIAAIKLDLEVFKTQVKTWGAAATLALGIIQFALSYFN